MDHTLDLTAFSVRFGHTQDLSLLTGGVEEAQDDMPLREVPGYRLGELIGKGAYGAIWSGIHLATGSRVAVKVLRSGPRQGLGREVRRILDVAEHPYVVPLIDAGLEHDPAFLVTPLMQGSLGGYLRQIEGPQEMHSDLVRLWMRQVAGALEYIHQKGVVHCDLKPDNILLDDQGNCRVCDFGQAALHNDGQASLGTYFFMPPQQALTSEAQVANHWDIYALGSTFYYLTTGQLPRCSPELKQKLASEPDPRQRLQTYASSLLQTPLTPCVQLNPQLAPDLARIIETCLELEPSRRFFSAAEVRQALTQVAAGAGSRPASLYLRSLGSWLRSTPLLRLLGGQPVSLPELNSLLVGGLVVVFPLATLLMLSF